ncbi:hypothetical protein B0H11DRAFT_2231548 [Mycena galericulata]|nr:hypothetical protein B0H11DRAFT_2240758 [Mycena galericulata]KAJ7484883.1 hypothetical protein B0H11DRAFT_2231548 [Mycena galericulata]
MPALCAPHFIRVCASDPYSGSLPAGFAPYIFTTHCAPEDLSMPLSDEGNSRWGECVEFMPCFSIHKPLLVLPSAFFLFQGHARTCTLAVYISRRCSGNPRRPHDARSTTYAASTLLSASTQCTVIFVPAQRTGREAG